mmetsp:Transcript_81294/g.263674  ORF Transcript_81294/g.263674 Transcript_81294/m.263674 type:complete len:386 (+) Transcript_81294:374-1531(+)
MHGNALHDLLHDILQAPRLELVARGHDAVAVHAVALPSHRNAALLNSLDVSSQHLLHLASAIARNDHDPTLNLVGIQDLQQLLQLVVLHRRTDLHSDGVCDASEVLQMRPTNLPRAIANPDQVGTQVVVLVSDLSRQRLLQVELHGLVRSEELRGFLRRLFGPDGTHILREVLELWRRPQCVDVDVGGVRRIGTRSVGPQIIHGGRRVEVALQQSLRIPFSILGLEAVDVVAFEGHDLTVPLHDLGGLAAGLAVLACDAAYSHCGLADNMLHDHAHLQDQLELGLQSLRLTIHEALGAIAALDNEALTTASLCQQLLQPVCLGRLDDRRQPAQLREDRARQRLILPLGHLLCRLGLPRRSAPFRHGSCRQPPCTTTSAATEVQRA